MVTVNEKMTAIANAIRSKTGGTDLLSLDGMVDAIDGIESGVSLPELTNEGASSDLLFGKQLIDSSGNVVEGTIATKTSNNLTASGATVTVPAGYYASQATKSVSTATQATPSITVSSVGLITASATQTAGYVTAGTKSATKQLTVQAAQTITPSTSDKTIASGRYLTGTQTIKGDANLVAGNIKKGVSIFGVSGTHEDGEDLTEVLNQQAELITQLETALNKATGGGGSAGGGSVTFETGSFTVTDNGMFEPGLNEYIFSSPNLNGLSRSGIMILRVDGQVGMLLRIDDSFKYYGAADSHINYSDTYGSRVTNDEINLYGNVLSSQINAYSFIAF